MGRWRNKFPEDQLVWFERSVGRYLVELGYPLSHPESNSQNALAVRALRIEYAEFLPFQTMGEGEHAYLPLDGKLLGYPHR